MTGRIFFSTIVLMVCLIIPLVDGTLNLSATAMIFPWVIGGIASILLSWEIVKDIRESIRTRTKKQEKGPKEIKSYLDGIAWTLVILPLVYFFGFLVAIPLYLFSYLKTHGYKLSFSIALSLFVEAFFYFIFVVALNVDFYQGLLFLYIME